MNGQPLKVTLTLVTVLLIAACAEVSTEQTQVKTGFQASDYFYPTPATDNARFSVGQVIYVPVYSHVYLSGFGKRELATTLNIRNTDPEASIVVQSVRYYDTSGKLLESYLADNHTLTALATAEVIVDQKDTRGGSGANFIVEWAAEQTVNTPIVEAVMVGITGSQGLSFSLSGQVIQEKTADHKGLERN